LYINELAIDAEHYFIRLLKLMSNRKKIGYRFLS